MAVLECPPGRRVSAVLFGNRHKLELLVALVDAGDEGVNLSTLAGGQGVSASVYYGPIKDLISVNLAERLGRVSSDRRCFYRRRNSGFWNGFRSLAEELATIEARAS